MKKYRIHMELRNDTYWEFIPQQRVFFFFWKNIGKVTNCYATAQDIIRQHERKDHRIR